MAFSKFDPSDLKPWVDKNINKFLGFSEPSLVTTAVNCLSNGFDRKQTAEKLGILLDDRKASKLSKHLFDSVDDLKAKVKPKRKHKEEIEVVETKKIKKEDPIWPTATTTPSPGELTSKQIQEMMAKAQQEIMQRKAAMTGTPAATGVKSAIPHVPAPTSEEVQKQRSLASLQAQIQARLSKPNLLATLQSQKQPILPPQPNRPAPLILNAEGKTVDEAGREIQLTQRITTLKANIRKQREVDLTKPGKGSELEGQEVKFFDPRIAPKITKPKRNFKFHEKGKFEQLGNRIRTKALLDKLKDEINLKARKTGISSAAKLALLHPKEETKEGDIPDVEWWDTIIIKEYSYAAALQVREADRYEGITHLVEHPTQMKPPQSSKPVPLPVFLTKKESKKVRRMNRREALKEKQEKVRLGLEPPPEPKVNMANLMRVLGTDAVQDPSKVEAHVRAQMAKRQKAHEEANAARKLTVEQRRDKKIRKLKEDTSNGVHVVVYRVRDLSNQQKKFKIETNANQLFMTGCVVLCRDCNVVIVEGGPKQQKKYRQLMMNRIKWSEEFVSNKAAGDDAEKIQNKCVVVWEGTVKNRSFGDVKFKSCPSETQARELLQKHSVQHYWDLAFSSAILEEAV